jgi:hypothetical protein
MVAITLATGVELAIPRQLLQGLDGATPAQLAGVEILGPGDSLHWESPDVDPVWHAFEGSAALDTVQL